MGASTTVRSMGHGRPYHHTIHGSWVPIPPYDPWPMGTPSMCHGSYNDVRHCFSHDLWGFVTIAVPMTYGKKSLNPVSIDKSPQPLSHRCGVPHRPGGTIPQSIHDLLVQKTTIQEVKQHPGIVSTLSEVRISLLDSRQCWAMMDMLKIWSSNTILVGKSFDTSSVAIPTAILVI